jgi:wyosine [tRNA(Phe)-imidazoG37] synthetase (radical SAM superfamily)
MADKKNYVFGPVPSRRLGLSLGIDIVPLKSCSLDCVYCQLGRSSDLTIERRSFVPIDAVVSQIQHKIEKGPRPDYLTISGSGEPTLNVELGSLIGKIRNFTEIPVAIITNGTLMYIPEVRSDCAKANVVLPSLDAGDEETFAKINRPHKGIHFDAVVSGLVNFRKEYAGQVWLEVFMIEDINTSDSSISNIRKQIALIRPDKVQLNTAVRPTTETGIRAISPDRMEELAKKIGFNAEVIADFAKATSRKLHASESSIIEMLQRRPCSLNDICSGLGIPADEAIQLITNLTKQSRITSDDQNGTIFFKIA